VIDTITRESPIVQALGAVATVAAPPIQGKRASPIRSRAQNIISPTGPAQSLSSRSRAQDNHCHQAVESITIAVTVEPITITVIAQSSPGQSLSSRGYRVELDCVMSVVVLAPL
jgi:hypothetical protein